MHNHNPPAANIIRNILQLLRTLVVPSSRQSLTHEARPRELCRIFSFVYFAGGEAVAVGWERLDDVFESVWGVDIVCAVEQRFGKGELRVD